VRGWFGKRFHRMKGRDLREYYFEKVSLNADGKIKNGKDVGKNLIPRY